MKAEVASTLRRIVLNDSSEDYIVRRTVFEPTIARLRFALDSDNSLSSDDGSITAAIIGQINGAVAFTLSLDGIPVTACCACWLAQASETWWERVAEDLFFRMTEVSNHLDIDSHYLEPSTVPWLTVTFCGPGHNMTDEQMNQMVSLERCLVWALIDKTKGDYVP